MTKFEKISIPYGAIKSGLNRGAQAPLFIFQFLMVRLKGDMGEYVIYAMPEFQFLMVRLKGLKIIIIHSV